MTIFAWPLRRFLGVSRAAFRRWQRRIMFLVGGLCVGAAAVLMAILADRAQDLLKLLLGVSRYSALVVTPLGFGLCALLAARVFPNAQGSGIPQVIAARAFEDRKIRQTLISLKTGLGKILLVSLGLLCGASIGREGPTVQVGAAIMGGIERRASNAEHAALLLAGAAAGIAAAFNTPLAGIVFGIEELGRSFEQRTSGLVLGTVIAAGITSLAVLGDYTYFGSTGEVLPLGRAWVVVPLCAVVCGLSGGIFSRILILFARGFPGGAGRILKAHPIPFAVVCGLAVACCGLAGDDAIYGTGYEQARAILHGSADLSRTFAPLKFIATTLSSISGIPGGIFAPSLAVGAGIGAEFHAAFQSIPVGALALIGMVAYLAGVVQTPITSFVIVSEMTADHGMIIPLMAAAIIATAVSKIVCPEALYHALAKTFIARAVPVGELKP